jgi:ethanolamine utilization protein EutA
VCEAGEVVDQTAVDIGARIISFDEDGNVVRLEEAGRRFAAEAGVPLDLGDCPTDGMLLKIVERMVERLFEAMGGAPMSDQTAALLRLDPLKETRTPDALTFSGGVSEYIYGHEQADYGDLGPLLAEMIKARVKAWGPRIEPPVEGIRATVVGASQYTIQVSGSTIFVSPIDTLPLRNVPVIVPDLPLDDETLDPRALAGAVQTALRRLDLHEGKQPVALCYSWRGSATFGRLDAFCRGVAEGVASILSRGLPLILVGDGDIGGLVGIHAKEEAHLPNPVVSVDGIVLQEFDFIDIGAILEASGAVPVVIKSLVFPTTAAVGRVDQQAAE